MRKRARGLGLKTADKLESQDICFVSGETYSDFIQRQTGEAFTPGEIVDSSGRVLGAHAGLPKYTVGQRRGLGIAASKPYYVLQVDPPGKPGGRRPRGGVGSSRVHDRRDQLDLPSPGRREDFGNFRRRPDPPSPQSPSSAD